MPGAQVQNGKAFEWAVASAWSDRLHVPIEDDEAAKTCRSLFNSLPAKSQESMLDAARAAVAHVYGLEASNPVITSAKSIRLATDAKGQEGDVRDVLIVGAKGTLGFSCKNNHDAFKHPRLSDTNDFVKQWGLDVDGCSPPYWKVVRTTFAELRAIREASGGSATWASLPDYQERFYRPVLEAFGAELLRLKAEGPPRETEVVKGLLSFLIGNHDFYKIVRRAKDRIVEIQGFNTFGTLSIPKPRTANRIVSVGDAGNGEYAKVVHLTNYIFKFRIHSAESRVIPSLKFDVRAEALPNVYSNHIKF